MEATTYRFKQGIRPHDGQIPTNSAISCSNFNTMKTGADETYSSSNDHTETGMFAVARKLINAGVVDKVFVVATGLGAAEWDAGNTQVDGLQPSTNTHRNTWMAVEMAYRHLRFAFPTANIKVPYVLFNWGEAAAPDASGETQAQTSARMFGYGKEVVDSATFEIRRITGQSTLPKVVWSMKPLSGGSTAAAQGASRRVSNGMWETCYRVPRLIASNPEYVAGLRDGQTNYTDGTHLNNQGYSNNGDEFGDAILRDLLGEETDPFHPVAFTFVSSSQIRIQLDGIATNDTETMGSITNEGFQVFDLNDANERTITSINVSGEFVEINSSAAFSGTDKVYFSHHQRGANVDPTGGTIRRSPSVRARFLVPFSYPIDTYAEPEKIDDVVVAAHSARSPSVDPRVVPAYTHSLNHTEKIIASRCSTWFNARASLVDSGNSQIHCYGKTGANWTEGTGGISRTTVSSREYVTAAAGSDAIDGPMVIPAGGQFMVVVHAIQAHSATTKTLCGSFGDSSGGNYGWAMYVNTRQVWPFLHAGVNAFGVKASSDQHPNDAANHIYWMYHYPYDHNQTYAIQTKSDNLSWRNVGIWSGAGTVFTVINQRLRLFNRDGNFGSAGMQISDCIVIPGLAPYQNVAYEKAIEQYFGWR